MLKLACANCGAPLEIGSDLDTFACGYCGSQQRVKRQGGVVALQKVETVIKAVQRGTDRTAAELALIRLRKELAELETERDIAISDAQERRSSALRGRRILTLLTFLIVFFGFPTLIETKADLSNGFPAFLALLWALGSVGLPIFVYRKTRLPTDSTPTVRGKYTESIQRIHEQVKAHRTLLDELH
jgi:DNA-directed RNA polymerase subunit RPC12/RpoP